MASEPNFNPFIDVSPFKNHIGTNYQPKDAVETAALQEYLKKQEAQLAAIDEAIARLQEEIQSLTEKKMPIQECYEAHKVFLNPIATLPPELLQDIFCLSLPDEEAGSMHAADAPVCLTRVCRSWRAIALGKPELWTRMHISIPSRQAEMDVVKSKAVGVQTWLDRSGSVSPLHISIYHNQPGEPSADSLEAVALVFDALRPYASRWGSLRLNMDISAAEPFINVPASELLSLRSIHLQLSLPHGQWGNQSPTIITNAGFLAASTLRAIRFAYLPESFLSYPINWSQITHLRLQRGGRDLDYLAYLRIFSQMHNLEYLRFESPWYNDEDDLEVQSFNTIIHFPHLKSLAVAEQSPCPKFGELFRCPSLEELEYHESHHQLFGETPSYLPDGTLAALLAHSGTNIKTLTFDPRLYSKAQILRYLSLCPAIETLLMLEVYSHGTTSLGVIDNDILQAFITPCPSSGGQVTCPRLSSFVCTCSATFTPSQFLDFLRVKQSGTLDRVARLGRVVVNFPVPDEGSADKEIRQLMKSHSAWVYMSYAGRMITVHVREGIYVSNESWHGFSWETYRQYYVPY